MNLKHIIGEFKLDLDLRKRNFIPDKNIDEFKGIGILFAIESLLHQQLAIKFADQIKHITQENTYLFGYINKRLTGHVTFGFPHFSLSDVAIQPDFTKHRLNIFMERNYRVLINLDSNDYKILHYVVAKTNALHKFAISPGYPALYSIIVGRDPADELPSLIEKTLEIFKKTVG